jgi:hypothetical protein
MQRANHVRRVNPEFARLTADDVAIFTQRMPLSAELFYRAADEDAANACAKRMREGRTAVTQTVRALSIQDRFASDELEQFALGRRRALIQQLELQS